MKIVLLGKDGMLGHALRDVFSDGFELFPVGREELDITDRHAVMSMISDIRPDIVLNATGYTQVDTCEQEKEIAMRVNGSAVGYIAEACRDVGAVCVHFSTDYVFDGSEVGGYAEDVLPHPLNVYGESKLLGEHLLQEKAKKYFLIRTSWLFGPNGKNFVDTMIRLGRENAALGKPMHVVNDQHGKPTYTIDLAQATKQLVLGEYAFGVYHLVNEDVTTWFDFAREIFRISHIDVTVEPLTTEQLARPAKRPLFSTLLNTKFPLMRLHQEALKSYLSM